VVEALRAGAIGAIYDGSSDGGMAAMGTLTIEKSAGAVPLAQPISEESTASSPASFQLTSLCHRS
jgi:hypothetical protein